MNYSDISVGELLRVSFELPYVRADFYSVDLPSMKQPTGTLKNRAFVLVVEKGSLVRVKVLTSKGTGWVNMRFLDRP